MSYLIFKLQLGIVSAQAQSGQDIKADIPYSSNFARPRYKLGRVRLIPGAIAR